MATLDKNFELSLNLPTATLTSRDMSLCNIDSNVFNIYLQLTLGSNNIVPNANLSEYTCTLIAVKPKTKEYVEQVGVVNGVNDNFKFDLTNKFNDQVGNYKCEIKVTKGDETITSTPFAYTVKGSIVSQLSMELERNPDIEILRQLINEVKELVGLKPGNADSLLVEYQKKADTKLNTESKEVVGAINELSSRPHGLYKVDLVPSNNVVNMTSDDVQNVTLTDSATINLPSNINSKEIFLNITCKSRSIIVTFAHGNDTTKVKLAFESYNVFQFSANGNDYMIERKSTKYPTLTPEEEKEGVSTGGLDLSIYQEKDDITLNTKSKNIVSAINEVEDYIQVVKTNGETIRSNAKIIIDETQDYDSTSFIKDDLTGSDNSWSARKIDKIVNQQNAEINNKTDKTVTSEMQQQINNLVLGAVGDGNNAEVVQARGSYNTLHERFNSTEGQFEQIETEFNNVIANVTNGNESVTNSEIVVARNGNVTLGERLDKTDSQINNIESNFITLDDNIDGIANSKNKKISIERLQYTQIKKYAVFLKKMKDKEPVKIECLGDSLTYGHDTTSDDKRPPASGHTETRAGLTYPESLRAFLNQIYPNLTVENKGFSGDNAHLSYTRWNKKSTNDLSIIMLGTNDANATWIPENEQYNIEQYLYWYEQIIVRNLIWEIPMLIVTPLRSKDLSLSYNTKIDRLRNACVMLAERFNIPWLDGEEFLRNHRGNIYSDDVHLNANGYKVFASKIASYLLQEGISNINKVQHGTKLGTRPTIDGVVLGKDTILSENEYGFTTPNNQYSLTAILYNSSIYYSVYAKTDDLLVCPIFYLNPNSNVTVQLNFGTVTGENTNDYSLGITTSQQVDDNLSSVTYSTGQNGDVFSKFTKDINFIKLNKGWNTIKITGNAVVNGIEFVDYNIQNIKSDSSSEGGSSITNVIDNLNSTSISDALSANQGRVLNVAITGLKDVDIKNLNDNYTRINDIINLLKSDNVIMNNTIKKLEDRIKTLEDNVPPPIFDGNYFDINNTVKIDYGCTHSVDKTNKTVTVNSDFSSKFDGYLIWDLPLIKKDRRYKLTCTSNNDKCFVRFRLNESQVVESSLKTTHEFEFNGADMTQNIADICFGIRGREDMVNPILMTTIFSDIQIIDINGEPPPTPASEITYDVKDYKIIVKKDGITESYHSNDDIPKNHSTLGGGVDGYKVVIKDRVKHYLALTSGSSSSQIIIDGKKPFNYSVIDPTFKSTWSSRGYAVKNNTLKYTIANRINSTNNIVSGDKTINPLALEKALKIYNCAIPGYMEIVEDSNSINSVSEASFTDSFLGVCRLHDGERFHIHQNIRLLGGYNNASRLYVGILVHELGHSTGIWDNSPHYPTTYTYNKNQQNEWLQPSDIAHIKDMFPNLTGKSTINNTFNSDNDCNVIFSFKHFDSLDEKIEESDLIVEVQFLEKLTEKYLLNGDSDLTYNIYNFKVLKSIKGNKNIDEIITVKVHESFNLDLVTNNNYKLFLYEYENCHSSLLNINQAIEILN